MNCMKTEFYQIIAHNNFLELTANAVAELKINALGITSIKQPLMQPQLRNVFYKERRGNGW